MGPGGVFSSRTLARLWLRGAIGGAAAALAVLSCYGVLALTLLLPLVGVRLALDEGVWNGVIILFTLLTVLAVLPGYRTHRSPTPGVAALAGGGLILHALLVDYRMLVELAGFVLLVGAVLQDSRRRPTPPGHPPGAAAAQRQRRHPDTPGGGP